MERQRSSYWHFQKVQLQEAMRVVAVELEREQFEHAHNALLEAARCACFLACSDAFQDGRKV